MKDDVISRQQAIDALMERFKRVPTNAIIAKDVIENLPSAQPELDSEALIRTIEMGVTATNSNDIYSLGMRNGMRWCKSLIDGVEPKFEDYVTSVDDWKKLPSAQPEKETPKRVLWSGWKGMRDTRYKCPNCKKPVRNTDIYCHRCGQKLMFPNIDFTPYIEGQKQELIVRWDDEE